MLPLFHMPHTLLAFRRRLLPPLIRCAATLLAAAAAIDAAAMPPCYYAFAYAAAMICHYAMIRRFDAACR